MAERGGRAAGDRREAAAAGEEAITLDVTGAMIRRKPEYRSGAGILLEAVERFFEDPENEKAFQEWKEEREAQLNEAAAG